MYQVAIFRTEATTVFLYHQTIDRMMMAVHHSGFEPLILSMSRIRSWPTEPMVRDISLDDFERYSIAPRCLLSVLYAFGTLSHPCREHVGGDDETRTRNRHNAIVMRSQLRYIPLVEPWVFETHLQLCKSYVPPTTLRPHYLFYFFEHFEKQSIAVTPSTTFPSFIILVPLVHTDSMPRIIEIRQVFSSRHPRYRVRHLRRCESAFQYEGA